MMGTYFEPIGLSELAVVWAFLSDRLLYATAVASAAFVIVTSVCRLTVICPRTTTLYSWAAMYVGLAALAMWEIGRAHV